MMNAAWLWGVWGVCGAGNEMWGAFTERVTSVDTAVTPTRDQYIRSFLSSVVAVALYCICKGANQLR